MSDELKQLMARRPEKPFDTRLSAVKIEEFKEMGFTRIDRITTDEEVEWLRCIYDVLFSGAVKMVSGALITDVNARQSRQRGHRIGQVLRPEWFIPQLKQTEFHKNSRAIARQLLDEDTDLELWGHMVRKAAHNPDIVAWHQDEAYWDPSFDYRSSAYWMPLDPATEESGCMSFIPGSHKWGVLGHRFTNEDPKITGLMLAEEIPVSEAVLQPVPIGGASIHHGRTLHFSGPNRSDHVRRAYINEWQAKLTKRATPNVRPWFWIKQKAMDEERRAAVMV